MCLTWRLAWCIYILLLLVHQGKAGGWSTDDGLDAICNGTEEISDCLRREAFDDIDVISKSDIIELASGVTLARYNTTGRTARGVAFDFSWIPGVNDTESKKLDSLFRGRQLEVDLSNRLLTKKRKSWKYWMNRYHMYEYQDMITRINDIKEKKMLWYLLMAISAMAAIAGPVAMNALGAIAAKALIISKVSVIIAGVVALKKLFASDHEGETRIKVLQQEETPKSKIIYATRPAPTTASLPDPYKHYYEHEFPQRGT